MNTVEIHLPCTASWSSTFGALLDTAQKVVATKVEDGFHIIATFESDKERRAYHAMSLLIALTEAAAPVMRQAEEKAAEQGRMN